MPSDEIDALSGVFDQAVGQWCADFGIDEQAHADWQVRRYLMKDPAKFRAAGLVPADLPRFNTGYARARELWLIEQPNTYYRRHLLLHEGTHAFMYSLVGGAANRGISRGSPSYSRRIAGATAGCCSIISRVRATKCPSWGGSRSCKRDLPRGRR